jgi:hypothetical protein
MKRDHCGPVIPPDADMAEQRFYIVMHHMATVLWMKGATVEALAALSAVLKVASEPVAPAPRNPAPNRRRAHEPPGPQVPLSKPAM